MEMFELERSPQVAADEVMPGRRHAPSPAAFPSAAPTLRTYTLGCKVNQYETEYVREGLLSIGYREAADDQAADLCVVNTCTVTATGDAKSRQAIRRLARRNPGTKIVVMGCYATRARDEVAALPGVVEVVTDKRRLPELLQRWGVAQPAAGISGMSGRHRAFVKVQDGCILNCSFCIIPQVRPRLTSRPPAEILEEVARLVGAGFREIVLTGIHLGHYGVDFNRGKPKGEWVRLADLVRRIAAMPGRFRIRLSSIEATELTAELIAAMREAGDRVCPHLHVSMQSGSDEVLRRMRRRWGRQRLLDRCRMAQEALDRPALTTDIIVGFPGETETDFAATCDAARAAGFSKIHIFPFSPREGTPAATMPDQIPPQEKSRRLDALQQVEAELRAAYFQSLLGRRLTVLAEQPIAGTAARVQGTSCRYAPVELAAPASLCGELVEVEARAIEGDRILARRAV